VFRFFLLSVQQTLLLGLGFFQSAVGNNAWGVSVMEAPAEGADEEMAQMAQLLGQMGGCGAGGLPPGVVQVGTHLLFCCRF
jgi:hypothetical protein